MISYLIGEGDLRNLRIPPELLSNLSLGGDLGGGDLRDPLSDGDLRDPRGDLDLRDPRGDLPDLPSEGEFDL